MMQLLRRLPFHQEQTWANVGRETVWIRPYQIVAWVSITVKGIEKLPRDAPRFPAILDTGNNHHFSLRESHLNRWAELRLESLLERGHIYVGLHHLPLVALNLWLHRNKPGERDSFARGEPFCLELEEGVAVYPHAITTAPRLPTLGLRALADNGLRLSIDGKTRTVSLTT